MLHDFALYKFTTDTDSKNNKPTTTYITLLPLNIIICKGVAWGNCRMLSHKNTFTSQIYTMAQESAQC